MLEQIPRRAFLDIELKVVPTRSTFETLVGGRGPGLERAVVSSFDPVALRRMAGWAPTWALWLNARARRPRDDRDGDGDRVSRDGIEWHALDAGSVARCRDADLEVAGWTVRRRPTFRRLERLGVYRGLRRGRRPRRVIIRGQSPNSRLSITGWYEARRAAARDVVDLDGERPAVLVEQVQANGDAAEDRVDEVGRRHADEQGNVGLAGTAVLLPALGKAKVEPIALEPAEGGRVRIFDDQARAGLQDMEDRAGRATDGRSRQAGAIGSVHGDARSDSERVTGSGVDPGEIGARWQERRGCPAGPRSSASRQGRCR